MHRYEQLVPSAPRRASQLFHLCGVQALRRGDTERARHAFERSIVSGSRDAATYVLLANQLIGEQQFAEAAEALAQVAARPLAGADARLLAEVGSVLCGLGQTGDAERAYRRSLELDPMNQEALEGLARLAPANPEERR